ncbi:glycosyltransferase family 1 protein [Geobacillus stearothermophilus]|uniref:glycosyltransferase family 4 protein n=1 Tax=Geobacillus stearothermophilus TaxID=1422 RepID=UPI003D215A08
MNIIVNAILFHEKPRGVGRYLNNLLKNLALIDKKNNYYIYYAPWMKEYEFLDIQQDNFTFICVKVPKNKLLRNLYQAFVFPFIILKHNPDLLHIPDTSPVFFTTCKTISTIHDLAEFHVPEKYSKIQSKIRKFIVKNQLKNSHHVLTVSHYSKNDMLKLLRKPSEKISVVYNGVDYKKFNKQVYNNLPKVASQKKYFLYVGELERTKNVSCIVNAYSLLPSNIKEDYHLILVGRKGNDFRNIYNLVQEKKIQSKVHFLDYVSDLELVSLYNNCVAFIFPSIFEGFGLPVLEAMACEAPVLCSNASCLPEIAGDAAMLFNPYDVNDLSNKMELIIKRPDLSHKLIENGLKRVREFCWKTCAKNTLDVYMKVINTK